MKRILLAIMAVMMMTGGAESAVVSCTEGTVDITRGTGAYTAYDRGQIEKIAVDFVSDAAGDGDVQGGANCDIPIHGYIYMVTIIPETGGTAPDATMDIYLDDSDGHDVMSSSDASKQLTNLAQASLQYTPLIGGSSMARYVAGNVSLNIEDAGTSNGGQLIIYVYRD